MTNPTDQREPWTTPSVDPVTDPSATSDRNAGMRNALSSEAATT